VNLQNICHYRIKNKSRSCGAEVMPYLGTPDLERYWFYQAKMLKRFLWLNLPK